MIKTIYLSNEEIAISGLDGNHVHIKNFNSVPCYASKTPGITPESDDVLTISGGTSGTLENIDGIIYLVGTDSGKIMIYSNNDVTNPF